MINRFKQFASALRAKVTPEEYVFVKAILRPEEQVLFMAMDVIDQRHSLDVAKTCQQLAAAETAPVNLALLYQAALLHDVGKRQGQISIPKRVLVVLLKKFLPWLFDRMAAKQDTFCFISKNHPSLGAQYCRLAGCQDELILLVELHQQGGNGKELELLIKADRQN